MKYARFRFYGDLVDFLNKNNNTKEVIYHFSGIPAVKDTIEAMGVPHTEVDLILINQNPASFINPIKDRDRVSVYPVFKKLDIGALSFEKSYPDNTDFILDVHLGKLAKYLRMLGFDTLYRNDYDDPEIIRIAKEQERIVLTRDIGLLKQKEVERGYYVRSQKPENQIKEIISRYRLLKWVHIFSRCLLCNQPLKQIKKEKILAQLQPKTKKYYNNFYHCTNCGKIYWKGSHFGNMSGFISQLL
jgi:hypothetical protein